MPQLVNYEECGGVLYPSTSPALASASDIGLGVFADQQEVVRKIV